MVKLSMKEIDLAKEWLKRAKSNLEKAKIKVKTKEILYEDLCFDCQQSAEKSFKALLVYLNTPFPKTHSINLLIELIASQKINIPDAIKESVILTDYAVDTRYPGDYKAINKEEYKISLKLAINVYEWVKRIINQEK